MLEAPDLEVCQEAAIDVSSGHPSVAVDLLVEDFKIICCVQEPEFVELVLQPLIPKRIISAAGRQVPAAGDDAAGTGRECPAGMSAQV